MVFMGFSGLPSYEEEELGSRKQLSAVLSTTHDDKQAIKASRLEEALVIAAFVRLASKCSSKARISKARISYHAFLRTCDSNGHGSTPVFGFAR